MQHVGTCYEPHYIINPVLDIKEDFEIEPTKAKGNIAMTTPKDDNHPHSIYGASGASRWRLCPGSVRVIEEAKENGDIPKKQTSEYADEGTIAHDWATKVLTDEILIDAVPEEFREHLEGYIAHCRGIEREIKGRFVNNGLAGERIIINEKTIPLFYRPQDKGTVDHAAIYVNEDGEDNYIHVTDLKYGAGIKVESEENDQAQIYAISLINELEIMEGYEFDDETPVHISIYQPRHYSFNGEPETWEVTVGFLREAARHIERDYKAAQSAESEDCSPSDKACLFCDAKGVCRVRAKTSFGGLPAALDIESDFDIEGGKADLGPFKEFDQETLTPDQVAWVCRNGGTLKKIIDDVAKNETERLLAGGEVREMKLIKGKLGNRAWRDEKEAEKAVRSIFSAAESYKPRKLLTAPQVLAKVKPMLGELSTIAKLKLGLVDEKTATKSKTECLIHRPEGKPKLVSIDDPAEALTYTNPVEDFEIEDENDISGLM